MYPAVLLIYFISAAVILLASLALTVHISLPYNKTGRASVLYNFILVFLRVFCNQCDSLLIYLICLFKIISLLGCYASYIGSWLPFFWNMGIDEDGD